MSEQTKPWLDSRLPVRAGWQTLLATPMPRELPYLATLGALITATVAFLALSGFVLSVYYVAAPGGAFDSIQFIGRDVNDGWLIHAFHATGTTMLFGTVYLLLFRAMLNGEYRAPGEIAWFLKLFLLLLLLLVGYLGYTLTDGAVSSWSLHNATLAAARLGGIPGGAGSWFFGGPAGDGTLARLAALHVALAMAGFVVMALHYAAKRAVALPSGRPVPLHPYYTSQYFVAFVVFALIFACLAFFAPHMGENRLNLLAASPLVVPVSLTPPWYLLPVASLAGLAPGPFGPLLGVLAAFAVLAALPWLDRSAPGAAPRGLYRLFVYLLAVDLFALCLAAAAPATTLSGILTTVFALWYFVHFLVATPLTTGAGAAK